MIGKLGVAKARDNIARAWLDLRNYERALQVEEKQRDAHAAKEGFTPEKAVVYGNLYVANLGLSRMKEAEGYFHQSNLNYAWIRDRKGILRNLRVLDWWLGSAKHNVEKLFLGYSMGAKRAELFVEALAQCIRILNQELFPHSEFTQFLQSRRPL